MLAQLEQTNAIEIIDESADDDALDAVIRYENMLEDLGLLERQIRTFRELHERGDEDAVALYADVQKLVKGMAIEFGICNEIFDRQDRQLQSNGLKRLIVAA